MPEQVFRNFLGYKPDIANPPFNSAVSGKNFVIHRHRDPQSKIAGWIEQAPGYAKKLYLTGSANAKTLPADDTVIRKISAFTPENFCNLYIPEHGGQNVCVLVGTYTKTGFQTTPTTIDRFGIWIRPYWNGAGWVDEWYELTEMFIFEIMSLGIDANLHKLYIDDGTFSFGTLDPTGIVFATDYFQDWSIVYDAFTDNENYDIVKSSGFDTGNYFLELLHSNLDFTSRTVGTKLLVYRAFLPREIPSTLSSFIYLLLSEARITSGNLSTDIALMAGYRGISFPLSYPTNPTLDYTKTIDRLVADIGPLEMWEKAVYLGICAKDGATDPLDAGTYWLKYSLVTDDGNESCLFDASTETDNPGVEWATMVSGNSLTLTAGQGIKINGLRSWGALPNRARYLRVYLSDDNGSWYRTVDIDLRLAATWASPQSPVQPITVDSIKHLWAVTPDIDITKTMWNEGGGPLSTAQRGGMANTDTGIIQFSQAAVSGRRTYAFGVRQGGVLYPNLIYATPSNGDGQPMFDTFGSVAENIINLEYNDGDALVAGWPYSDRVLAFKSRSVVLLSYDNSGGFVRIAITKADGICSKETLADFGDIVFWAGYNGIYSYSARGISDPPINADWLEEWKALSAAIKQAAVATFDRVNRQYRIAYNGVEKCFDIDTGEWVPADVTDQPSKFSVNQREGAVDFLSGSLIYTRGTLALEDDASATLEYVTNDFIGSEDQQNDLLINSIRIAYDSTVALTVVIYRDGVAQTPVALAAGNGASTISAGRSFRCKRFAVRILAVLASDSDTVEVKQLVPAYQIIPTGLSRPAFASEGNAAAIEQRPMTLADIRSGTYTLVANVETVVPYTLPFITSVGTMYTVKADAYNEADEWIMSVEARAMDRFGFTVTSPENGYVKYVAASYQ